MSKNLIFDCGDHKIEFDSENYRDSSYDYFYWDDEEIQDFIQLPEYDGWRLPTVSEMQYLINNYMCIYGYSNSIRDSEQACIFDDRLVLPNKGWASGITGEIRSLYHTAIYWTFDPARKFRWNGASFLWANNLGGLIVEQPISEMKSALPIRLCRTVKEEINNNMDNIKEINIVPPEGYTIDEENSTFKKIVFRKVEEKSWRNRENTKVSGWWISDSSKIYEELCISYDQDAHNIFAIKKQAKSTLAMAQISQIMVNDERFGGPITDEEWNNTGFIKYTIVRHRDNIEFEQTWGLFHFLAFHTTEQRTLFLKENEDLVKDYLMLD